MQRTPSLVARFPGLFGEVCDLWMARNQRKNRSCRGAMTGGAVERVRGRARDEGQREEAAVHHGTNDRSGPRAAPLRRSVALSRKGGLIPLSAPETPRAGRPRGLATSFGTRESRLSSASHSCIGLGPAGLRRHTAALTWVPQAFMQPSCSPIQLSERDSAIYAAVPCLWDVAVELACYL